MKAIIGIDISKRNFTVALMLGSRVRKNEFDNDEYGFKKLRDWLTENGVTKARICMEATGSYGERLADFLYYNGYEVSVLNPMCIRSYAKSRLSRHKTDGIDAILIAEYASKNYELVLYKPRSSAIHELKALHRCLQSLKGQYVQAINHLENKFVLPQSVITIWQDIANDILAKINIAEATMNELISSDSLIDQDVKNLGSIPGIGTATAIAIIAETPEITSFQDARQLAAFIGITPSHKTSGSSVRFKSRISKIGSKYLRKALYFPAIVAKRCNPILKDFSEKLKAKGKHNMVILIAVVRKLVHIIYGILKHKTSFKPSIENS